MSLFRSSDRFPFCGLFVLVLCASALSGMCGEGENSEAARTRLTNWKLENITIPKIDFRQADVRDILDFLTAKSADLDPGAGNMKGVNIVLALKPRAGEKITLPALTLRARGLKLGETLDVVTEMAGLRYFVRGNVIFVVSPDATEEQMLIRMYDVLPVIESRIEKPGREIR
ncbi:MAG: hypothetical protein R6V03_01065 [Kiritimatiellia bacterium]